MWTIELQQHVSISKFVKHDAHRKMFTGNQQGTNKLHCAVLDRDVLKSVIMPCIL